MNISIKTVEPKEMPFTTLGYWEIVDEGLRILIVRMSDWRFEVDVLIHEIIEACWCIAHNVTQKQCDEFDASYERLYESGSVSKKKAPGDNRRCPYHWGHWWGDRFSNMFDWIVGIDKKKFRREADELMGIKFE